MKGELAVRDEAAATTFRLRLAGSRPRPGDWPDCLVDDEFDCAACVYVDPDRCDLRADPSLLEYRRRHNYFERGRPKPGLQSEAHKLLLESGEPLAYDEIARRLSVRRGRPVSPVVVLEEIHHASTFFLPLGQGRFLALSDRTRFDRDTDNLWYDLPPYDENAGERTRRFSRRIATAQFVSALPDLPRIIDAIRAVFGPRQKVWPEERDLASARERHIDDRLGRAGVDFIADRARVSPRPDLYEAIDVAAIARHADRARKQIVEDNLRLVLRQALKYAGRGVPFTDLCQEGVLGVLTAAEKYDGDVAAFSTYAVWWIRQTMTRTIADKSRLIRVPVHLYEKSPWLMREHDPQAVPLGVAPTLRPLRSLDRVPERQLPVLQADPLVEEAERHEKSAAIREALAFLTDRQREVVELRFGLDGGGKRTLEAVGRKFGVTRERIRQIESKALTRLRHPSRRLRRLLDERVREPLAPLQPTPIYEPGLSLHERYVIARRFGLADGRQARIPEIAEETHSNPETIERVLRRSLDRIGPFAGEAMGKVLQDEELANGQLRDVRARVQRTIGEIPAEAPDLSTLVLGPDRQAAPMPRVPPLDWSVTVSERVVLELRLGLVTKRPLEPEEIAERTGRSLDQVRSDLANGLDKLPRSLLLDLADRIPDLLDDVRMIGEQDRAEE